MSRLLTFIVFACVVCLATGPGTAPVFADGDEDVHAEAEPGADAEHGEEGHGSGPPMSPKADLALWSLITFVVFVFVLKKLAWKPLIEGLDKRESGMRHAVSETQRSLEQAKALLQQHEQKLADTQDQVREIIAEAKRDAERTSQDIIEKAQNEAAASRERALDEIERAKDLALKELFDSLSGQVAGATEHVLGRSLNAEDQDRLIAEALGQFSE